MRTPSPDKRERESSSSIEMTPSPGSTTTESTTSQPSHTGSTTDGSIIHSSPTSKVSTTGSTVVESTSSESTDNEASDSQYSESESESTMTEERGRTDAQWWELREGWILHRYKEKTAFTCHQCNKKKTDILVAMKPEKNWDNMCCNACFCMKIGQDSDEWNLVHVDGVDHIW